MGEDTYSSCVIRLFDVFKFSHSGTVTGHNVAGLIVLEQTADVHTQTGINGHTHTHTHTHKDTHIHTHTKSHTRTHTNTNKTVREGVRISVVERFII